MPKREALKREPSTGNVFADLGLADAGKHLTKAGQAGWAQSINCGCSPPNSRGTPPHWTSGRRFGLN